MVRILEDARCGLTMKFLSIDELAYCRPQRCLEHAGRSERKGGAQAYVSGTRVSMLM